MRAKMIASCWLTGCVVGGFPISHLTNESIPAERRVRQSECGTRLENGTYEWSVIRVTHSCMATVQYIVIPHTVKPSHQRRCGRNLLSGKVSKVQPSKRETYSFSRIVRSPKKFSLKFIVLNINTNRNLCLRAIVLDVSSYSDYTIQVQSKTIFQRHSVLPDRVVLNSYKTATAERIT